MDCAIPAIYECSAKALTEMKCKKGSLRQIMDQFQEQPKIAKAIFGLTTKVLRNLKVVRAVIESTGLKKKVECDDALMEVIVGEILFGHRVKDSRNQVVQQIIKYRKRMLEKFNSMKKVETPNKVPSLPVKYLRINLLKTSMDEVIKVFESNGYTYNNVENCASFEEFLKIIGNIERKTFVKDFHFPNELLIFNINDTSEISSADAYRDGKMIFFDKASLMAVEMLHIKKGMTVLDVCGAPGMKTAAIASRFNNELNIISVDRDSERCEEMNTLLSNLGVDCVDARCADFLDENSVVDVNPDVILLDPSCSGSGMFDRLDYDAQEDKHRCYKLASFQTKMLCKAMSLKPKRIVYSTCSTNVIENEFVIKSALKEAENGNEYELVEALPSWPRRGENELTKCIRSDVKCLTKGFFAAALRRKE